MKQIFFLFLIVVAHCSTAQQPVSKGKELSRPLQQDSLQKPAITAYKIISAEGDTTYIDTTLAIYKQYKFNFLRKDNFELVPFSNVGRPYNHLAYNLKREELIPRFAAQARHVGFLDAEDIYYYEVPTPLTEIFFKTVPEQGQILDAFFTVNTSPRLNFSAAYKGVRSLGTYQNELTSTGIFRATLNYNTKNERYRVKTHFVSQDLLNQENGGLDDSALIQFFNKEPEFEDRSLLEVKFENAENELLGKRFYLNQEYDLASSENNTISLSHILNFSDQKYLYRQAADDEFFGGAFRSTNLRDQVKLRHIKNIASVTFKNKTLGKLSGKAGVSYFNYGYDSFLILEDDQVITNRLTGYNYSLGAEYENTIGELMLYGDAMINLAGEFDGHYLTAGAGWTLNEDNAVMAEININKRAPNFNFLLYQSDYFSYNWQTNFENESVRSLKLRLASTNLLNMEAEISQIDQYAYFTRDEEEAVKPFQYSGTVNYVKVKANREFKYGKFSLDNTLMYQVVTSGEEVFNVPAFVTRNSLYYSDHLFQKALYLQTGFIFKYFTPYQMNAYDPVLAEFYVQNQQKLGGFPKVDFFFNAKIRQTRIFFNLENVNYLFDGNNNFSAPGYPHRDFLLRFGLVWNFFL